MSRERLLAKNTIILGFGSFIPRLIGIITLPILTGYLTKTEYGTYDLLLTLISLIMPLTTLQIQSSAFRFLVQSREDFQKSRSIISTIMLFTCILSFVPMLIIFGIMRKYLFYTRICVCLYFFIDNILQTLKQIARGRGNNFSYSLSTIVTSVINMILLVLCVKGYRMGLFGVIISIVIADTIASIWLALDCKLYQTVHPRCFSYPLLKNMLSYSWPLIPNNLSSWIMTLSDRIVLSAFLGIEANAVYAVAKKMPNLLNAVQSTFTLAWQENATLTAKDADVGDYYSKMFSHIFNITIGTTALLISFSPILFKVLVRGKYDAAYYHMPILFIGMTFSVLASFLGGIYVAEMKTKSIGITTTIAAVLNLVIDLLMVKKIGMWAASLSTVFSYLFLFIFRLWDIQKFRKLNYKKSKLFLCILVLIFMCFLSSFNKFCCYIINFIGGTLIAFLLNRSLILFILNSSKNKLLRGIMSKGKK